VKQILSILSLSLSNRIAIDRYEYVQGEQIFMRKKIERFVRQGKDVDTRF